MIKVEADTRLRLHQAILAAHDDVEISVPKLTKELQRRFDFGIDHQKKVGDEYNVTLVAESDRDFRKEIENFLKGKGLTRVGKMSGIIDVYPPKWGRSRIKIVRLYHENGHCSVEIKGQDELAEV